MAQIYINDKPYEFKEGETILDVARRNNIYIPVMCYLKDITPTGACRLCLVEVEGIEKPVASCVTYAIDGMKVYTDTEQVVKQRNMNLEFILIKHPLDCPKCDKAGECLLQDTTYEFGITDEPVKSDKPKKPKSDWEMIFHDPNLCVLCERCVKVCHEITGNSALKIEERGYNNYITTVNEEGLSCDFCGLCVDFCPVGALLDKPYKHSVRTWDLEYVETVCNYCPAGCQIQYGKHENVIYKSGKTDDSYLCSRGRYAYKYTEHNDRIKSPLVKSEGSLQPVEWAAAIDAVKGIFEKGKGKTAFLLGSRLPNEALINYKKLAEGLDAKIVTDISFYNQRFFELYREKFGTYDTVGTFDDLKKSNLIFVIGSDINRETLGLKWRLMNAVVHNDSKLVTLGVKKYEYDFFTDASLVVDYADFAKELDKIKNSEENIYKDIREYIEKADKVSFIVGNEYLEAEEQLESVFDFVDYVGEDKLHTFFYTYDKPNINGMFTLGIFGDYSADSLLNDMESGKIEYLFVADYYPFKGKENNERFRKLVKKLKGFVVADLFANDFNKDADVVLPVLAHLENEGTYLSLDGRLLKFNKVLEADADLKSDAELGYLLGFALGIEMESYIKGVWEKDLQGKLLPDIEFNEINGMLYKEKSYKINKTDFAFKKPKSSTKHIFVNAKYHNNFLTTKAAIEKKSDATYRKYFFDVDRTVYMGESASYNGKAVVDKELAKGVVLIPKN